MATLPPIRYSMDEPRFTVDALGLQYEIGEDYIYCKACRRGFRVPADHSVSRENYNYLVDHAIDHTRKTRARCRHRHTRVQGVAEVWCDDCGRMLRAPNQ